MNATLVNPRFGIIRGLEAGVLPAHFPPTYQLLHSRIADTTRFTRWSADQSGAGFAFGDADAATAAAVGEGVERYCGNLVPSGLVNASYDELRRSGRRAVDPEHLCLFSPDQHRRPGFLAEPFSPDLAVDWVAGVDLADNAGTLAPASVVWPSYVTGAPDRPRTNPVIQAGLAAGPSLDWATTAALNELVERDAMTMSWWGRRGVRLVQAPRWFRDLAAGPDGALSVELYAFDDEWGVPVLGALLTDSTTGYLTLGMGVAGDATAAATKALGEALQLQVLLAEYDDPAGPLARAAASPASPLKPWRGDRRYGESYRADRADVIDYACHLQLHLDPRVQQQFRSELAAATTGAIALDDLGPADGTVLGRLLAAGHQLVRVDLTTADVAPTGLRVVRVVATGLYSNAPMGLLLEGGDRLAGARAASRLPVPTTPLPH